jgi:uncharacterized hydrophobic protein (TIGR00271 family)
MVSKEKHTDTERDILAIKKKDQYRTVDELIKKSQPSSIYYTLLFLSAFIVTAGILLNNAAIIIGGMLVAPVLTPVLFIALGLNIGELKPIRGAVILTLKSVGIVVLSGLVLSLIFGGPKGDFGFDNTIATAALYFLVALAAGIAGTFAWARKDIVDIMPGVAIAVSLVPPLSLVGIGISQLSWEIARFNFLVSFFNLIGIIVGSLVVFSLLQFYKTRDTVQKKAAEIENHNTERK